MRLRTPQDIGLTIRDHRRHRRMSQQALAGRIGVSRQWVVEVEQGKARAEVGLVLRALLALGAELSVNLPGLPSPAPDTVPLPEIDLDAIIERARRPLDVDWPLAALPTDTPPGGRTG